jgi:hypothetical protein
MPSAKHRNSIAILSMPVPDAIGAASLGYFYLLRSRAQ